MQAVAPHGTDVRVAAERHAQVQSDFLDWLRGLRAEQERLARTLTEQRLQS